MSIKISKKILNKAKKIKLLAMDVDGVLTGGEIIILNNGEEIKIWSVQDRMGFALLKNSDLSIKLAWITARESIQVKKRAEDIGIHFLFQKCPDKLEAVKKCADQLGLTLDEVAYVGDDYVDLRPLKNVGFSACPPESPDLVKKASDYQTAASSGKGVVREVIEILLIAQNKWEKVMSRYLIIFCFLISSISFVACKNNVPPPSFTEKPDQWIEHFTITETSEGVPVWVLNSETAQIYNQQKRATLDAIRIQFMNPSPVKKQTKASLFLAKKNQTQAARLIAPKGEVKLDSHNLSAWGGVEVYADDGSILYTDQLHFSTERQKIYTEVPVKIIRNGSILLGEGLEATPDLSVVKILHHEASIYPKQFNFERKN